MINISVISDAADTVATTTAIANVVIAAAALLVAGVSIWFTNRGIQKQSEHNRLSVVPIPFIALADFENHLRVRVRNDGTGPMIVRKVSARRAHGAAEHDDLVSYMPELPPGLSWTNFSSGEVGSIPVGGDAILLELKVDQSKTVEAEFRDSCRQALSGLEIVVEYTDVYQSEFPPKTRCLDWFSRRLAASKSDK